MDKIDMWEIENGLQVGVICGVDEAGRGPLAGPVCAAAVILPQGEIISGLMVLAVFYGATMFWMSKFFMAFLFVVFVLGGCLLLVLAEVFRLANRYKEENDMTI